MTDNVIELVFEMRARLHFVRKESSIWISYKYDYGPSNLTLNLGLLNFWFFITWIMVN